VQVSLRRSGTDVELVVQDNGEGISPEFLPYVFDRFRQAQAGTTRRHGGLGLGLALVRHLVEAHGGTVRAEMVSDIGMPDMDGYELMRQFRAQPDAATSKIPAIALTAYAREEDRRLALEAGFDAHAAKPIDPDELVRLVANLSARVVG
jgi:CheY-like chemotaxis protein